MRFYSVTSRNMSKIRRNVEASFKTLLEVTLPTMTFNDKSCKTCTAECQNSKGLQLSHHHLRRYTQRRVEIGLRRHQHRVQVLLSRKMRKTPRRDAPWVA